jgi:aconitate hydratase
LALGLKKSPVEVAVAYDGACVTDALIHQQRASGASATVPPEALHHSVLIGRPGVGFPAPLHLERFASPARLAVTDDPRLSFTGGLGMLCFVLPPSHLAAALTTGSVALRPPRSVQILLSGKMRPFVCARDVALELLRGGLAEVVRRIDQRFGAPVVLEFAGPSAKLLSVPERAVLCAIAPTVGAASAVFISDEKCEAFLRDQRRSKAHRALFPDAGAPCDDVVSLDIATVDPLLMDANGEIKPVRDMAGTPIHQVILGGDSGITLRDMLAAAALLKSKRIPSRLEFLLAPPSRQILEILTTTGALLDLIATGARLIEPDHRILTGRLYSPAHGENSLRTFDPEPTARTEPSFLVASAETLAFAIANGQLDDPRSFKRPVRVTVPRVFPTDDVLIARPRKSTLATIGKKLVVATVPAVGFDSELDLTVHVGVPEADSFEHNKIALVARNDHEIRRVESLATSWLGAVRAVVAEHIPTEIALWLGGLGIAAFRLPCVQDLHDGNVLHLPAPARWPADGQVEANIGKNTIVLTWLGRSGEKEILRSGLYRPPHPHAKANA